MDECHHSVNWQRYCRKVTIRPCWSSGIMCSLAPIYRDNDSEQSITSFVGGKLSFVGSGLVGSVKGVSNISGKPAKLNSCFEVNCEFAL